MQCFFLKLKVVSFVFFMVSCTTLYKKENKIFLTNHNRLIIEGENHFRNIKQLTFEGENAEAYFSSDGKKLIFQGHDEDALCDQIYILNVDY